MARRTTRARTRRSEVRNGAVGIGVDVSVVPRALLGAVSGVEIVAVGALQLTRDVLLSAVSGAASVGAEALTATTAGVRGMVSATSQMIGDIATTAEGTFRDALNNARHSRPGARMALRPAAPVNGNPNEEKTAAASTATPRPRGAARRRRPSRQARTGVAA